MSRALQICLMILTAALCGICVLQWQRETQAGRQHQALVAELSAAQNSLSTQKEKLTAWEKEISRLNTALTEQAAVHKAHADSAASVATTTRQLEAQAASLTQMNTTVETLTAQLKKALDERDALATRLNQRTREFNTLAEKYRKAP